MSGRFAACSRRAIPDAMRERFGARAFAVPLLVTLLVSLLVLSAEISGTAAAVNLATGIALPVWVIPVALLAWGLLWRATFSVIENGVSLLGFVTVVFAVAAVKVGPDSTAAARGSLPSLPTPIFGNAGFGCLSRRSASHVSGQRWRSRCHSRI